MRVRCVAENLSAEREVLQGPEFLSQQFQLTVGRDYLVYGIQFRPGRKSGSGCWIEYETELGYLGFAPLMLFEINEPKVSRFWQIGFAADGTILLEPPSFRRKYYFDDLSSGAETVIRDFAEVKKMLQGE